MDGISRGREKLEGERRGGGKEESAKIYVHARVRGYRGSAGGGWNRRGKQAYIACVVPTLAEEFGRRLRPGGRENGGRGPGGRVEQRLPN